MPYLIGHDFRVGVDRRRRRIAGQPGSMWECVNAHLTRGGDIEKRKKYVPKWTVSGNTFGLRTVTGVGYVFGSDPLAAVTVSSGVTYQQLVSPSPLSPAMTALNDVAMFNGKLYTVATFDDGNTHHFYDGVWVSSWDDGVVRSYTTGLDVIAARLAALINANASEKATAASVGSVITITGKTVDVALLVTAEAQNATGGIDDQTATVAITQVADATHAETTTVTLAGTLEVGDRYAVKLNVNEYGAGDNPEKVATRLITFNTKLYAYIDSKVYFSSIGDCTLWRSQILGAGFINVSTVEGGSLTVIGAARYQAGLAFYADDTIQTWTIDPDPALNAVDRTMMNTGTIAGRSAITYGNNDSFYLARSGLRSLQARTLGTTVPFVSDSGNAIDSLLIARMRELGPTVTASAIGAIELVDGRYTLALGNTVYVLSYFPASKINGWSWYEPGFVADWVSVDAGKMYIRSGNTIYLYGGDDGNTYDSDATDMYEVRVGLPFLSGKRVADDKTVKSYEVSSVNEWLVEALVDSRDEGRKIVLGVINGDTIPDETHPADFDGTSFAMQFTCSQPGPASLTAFALDYDETPVDKG
jgi:hypothetical protein